MTTRTKECPVDESLATGRQWFSNCGTASVHEFKLSDGSLVNAGEVAGHGWTKIRPGNIDEWKTCADGSFYED